jgi:hypothetical protein
MCNAQYIIHNSVLAGLVRSLQMICFQCVTTPFPTNFTRITASYTGYSVVPFFHAFYLYIILLAGKTHSGFLSSAASIHGEENLHQVSSPREIRNGYISHY